MNRTHDGSFDALWRRSEDISSLTNGIFRKNPDMWRCVHLLRLSTTLVAVNQITVTCESPIVDKAP